MSVVFMQKKKNRKRTKVKNETIERGEDKKIGESWKIIVSQFQLSYLVLEYSILALLIFRMKF